MTEADSEPSRLPVHTRSRTAFLIVVGGTFGLQALTMVTGIILARILGVEGRGLAALVFALGLVASQLSFGGSLPVAVAKNLAERRVAARDGLHSFVRRRAALLLLPCAISGGFMLVLLRDDAGMEKYAYAAAVAGMTLQTIIFRLLTGSLQGEIGHLGRMAGVAMIPQLLFTIALATAWWAGWNWSALDALVAYFAASFIGLAVGFKALAAPTRRLEDRLDESDLWSQTRKTYVSSVRPIDGLGLDRILIGTVMGNAGLGLYAAAIAVANLCGIIGSAVSVIVLPQVAMRNADPVAQRAVIRRWLWLTAGVVAVVVGALEMVVAPVIRIAFGEPFVGAIDCARWLIVADGLLGFRKVLIAVLQGQGRGGRASWIELALAPVMVVAVVWAALDDNLPAIGIAMMVVAALSCASMALTLVLGGRVRGAVQPEQPVVDDDHLTA